MIAGKMNKYLRIVLCLLCLAVPFVLNAPAQAQSYGVNPHVKPTFWVPVQALTPVPPAPSDADTNDEPEPQETFGTKALNGLIATFDELTRQTQSMVGDYAAWPETLAWLDRQSSNPKYHAYWEAIGNDLIFVVRRIFPCRILAGIGTVSSSPSFAPPQARKFHR